METPMSPRIADILRRAETGDVTAEEQGELEAWMQADDGFGAVADALREAVGDGIDVTAEVDARLVEDHRAMEVSAFADGEVPDDVRADVARRLMRDAASRGAISAQAELGAAVRAAVVSDPVDVWPGVARAIGGQVPDEEAEWRAIAGAIRDRLVEPSIDVSAAVMAAVEPYERPSARWVRYGAPVAVFAAAAAVLLALVPPALDPEVETVAAFELSAINDARVEDIQYAAGVVGTVIPPQGIGDVMVIVIDDSALAQAEL